MVRIKLGFPNLFVKVQTIMEEYQYREDLRSLKT